MSRGRGPPRGGSSERPPGSSSTSRAPRRFAPSGQGLPAAGPARRAPPRPQLQAPGLRRGGGAGAARPGQAPSAAAVAAGFLRGGSCSVRGAPSPRACAARPPARGSAGRRRWSGPRPGLGRGAGGAGAGGGAPGRSPEPRRGEPSAARWVRGAEAGGPRRRERLPASAAAASETRRAGFPERQALGAGRPLQPPPAAGRRWPEPARDPRLPRPAGRGPRRWAGGRGGRVVPGSGLWAGPAAACPARRALSAAAVTV